MKKKIFPAAGAVLLLALALGCSSKNNAVFEPVSEIAAQTSETEEVTVSSEEVVTETVSEISSEEEKDVNRPEDGVYTAEFHTDNSMFHVNEVCDGKGTLTVNNGEMVIHISLPSKSIVNLYEGLAEDAEKEGAQLLEPSVDSITYPDGLTEDVHGFDIHVPYLDDEFDVALIGTKGVWYDHKVYVSNPVPVDENAAEAASDDGSKEDLTEGDYTIEADLEGGSGKATITSPLTVKVTDEGMKISVEWSSPNYDYMLVGEEKYLPVNENGNSVFELPVSDFDKPLDVVADTTAMSKPHEIEYTIVFHPDTLKEVK